jgi:anti-sigma regulatory factor (Ser/Thr protein kinase)
VCRMADTELGDDVSTVPLARHLVAELLRRWELPALQDSATLLISELVTNALVHAGSGLRLVVAVSDGVLELGVSDHDLLSAPSVRPRVARLGDEEDQLIAEGGRGLLLVDSLADRWGVVQRGQEKQVWCHLDTDDWAYRSACPCHRAHDHANDNDHDHDHDQHHDHDQRVRLPSGRYAVAMPGPWTT